MMELAARMIELGIKPEVEIYDTGHLGMMLDLLKKDLLLEPLQVSFVMGVQGRHAGRSRRCSPTWSASCPPGRAGR